MSVLSAGAAVPEFELKTSEGEPFTAADLAGKRTVLVFYPFAFSPVCTDQLQLFERKLDEFAAAGATVYGISCDAGWSQKAFADQLGVSIAQLSDFEPKGATCEAFGVLHEGGFAQRALIVVSADGVIEWSYQAPSPAELPGPGMVLAELH